MGQNPRDTPRDLRRAWHGAGSAAEGPAQRLDPKAVDTAGEQGSQSRQPAPSQLSPRKTRSVSQSAADPGKDSADCSSNPDAQGVSQLQKRPRKKGRQAAAEGPAVAAVAAEPAAVELNEAVGTFTAARGHQDAVGSGPEAGNALGTLPVSSNFRALQASASAHPAILFQAALCLCLAHILCCLSACPLCWEKSGVFSDGCNRLP